MAQTVLQRLRLQIHPVDGAITVLLLLSILISLATLSNLDSRNLLFTHLALLALFLCFIAAAIRWSTHPWLLFARPLVAAAVIFTLYETLGKLGMAAMPYRADGFLANIDAFLFAGHNPTFLIQRWQTPPVIEFFAFFYGLFIPYINLSILLGACGRPPFERDQFVTGWILTYAISYLGYLFLPATGPGAFFANAYTTPMPNGPLHQMILLAIANSGGMLGAFPSLHVGSSLYLCLFDLRTNRLRGLTYVPIVLLIYGATIFLRFHYVIDLIAGTLIASTCIIVGPRLFAAWARARQAHGLPAIPAGEGDVLPVLPNPRGHHPAPLLSAN
jgi:membrane-associated phospholipid phosphatase